MKNTDVKEYLKRKVDVIIYHNNENGSWVWAIDVCENPGFWLNAFEKKEDAIEFCKNHELKILNS